MSIFSLHRISEICLNYKMTNKLTQKQMGELLGINEQTYAKIEREQYFPQIKQIDRILEVTHTSIEDIKTPNDIYSVLTALKGSAENDHEKQVLEILVKAILCIDKHKNISEGSYNFD